MKAKRAYWNLTNSDKANIRNKSHSGKNTNSGGNNEIDIGNKVTATLNRRLFKILSIKQVTNF